MPKLKINDLKNTAFNLLKIKEYFKKALEMLGPVLLDNKKVVSSFEFDYDSLNEQLLIFPACLIDKRNK